MPEDLKLQFDCYLPSQNRMFRIGIKLNDNFSIPIIIIRKYIYLSERVVALSANREEECSNIPACCISEMVAKVSDPETCSTHSNRLYS